MERSKDCCKYVLSRFIIFLFPSQWGTENYEAQGIEFL